MKKLFLVILFELFTTLFLCGQKLLWEKTQFVNPDSINSQEGYSNTVWSSPNEIMVLGGSVLFGYAVVKYNLDGTLININQGVQGMVPVWGEVSRNTNDNFFYCGGVVEGFPNYTASFFVQEVKQNNDTLPRKRYYFPDFNGGTIYKQFRTKDRNIILGGTGTQKQSSPFISILKIDSNYNQIWFKAYPKIGIDTGVYSASVIENHKGNYVAQGSFFITSKKYEHPYMLEINPEGDTVRSKIIIIRNKKVREDGYKRGLTATADKGYLFVATLDTFMTNKNVPEQIGAVVKLDSNFNTQWVKYLISGTNTVEPNNILELADSSYLISAVENKFFSDYYTKTSLYKVSKSGVIISQWYLPATICSTPLGLYMFPLNDSSIILTGTCGLKQGYIARIGGVGNPMHPSPRPAPFIPPPEPVYTIPNLITPNNDRANDTFEILSNQIPATGVQLKIYNRWGSQIYTNHDYQHNWSAEGLADGVYYYQVEVNNKKYKGWVQVIR